MKEIISNIAKSFGYRITKNITEISEKTQVVTVENKESLLITFYNNLKAAKFYPKNVVDVGANTGTWTRELLHHFPDAHVLMVEPQISLQKHSLDVQNENVQFVNCGASNKNDTLLFTIHERDDSCSFIYTQEEAKAMGLEQIEIPVKTLNSIIKENNFPTPDIIKIDAEGLDLEVIEGASDFYGKTEIFLVEASVCCTTYKNTVAKIVKLMDQCGYQMFEITDLNRPFSNTPVLWLIEIAFVKNNSKLVVDIKI